MGKQPAPLTDKQRQVYQLVVQYFAATGESCGLSYLARRLQKNKHTIRGSIVAIVKKGWADTDAAAFRRLRS